MKNGWYDDGFGNLYHYVNDELQITLINNFIKDGWVMQDEELKHCVNGKCHNIKAPASIWSDGEKFWCQHDVGHRLDGPASECNNGKYWFYQGEEIKCKSQQEFERYLRLKLFW